MFCRFKYLLLVGLGMSLSCTLPERTEKPPGSTVISQIGAEGEACGDNDICDEGLLCIDDLCVQAPDSEADAGSLTEEPLSDSGTIVPESDAGNVIEEPLIDSGIIVADEDAGSYSVVGLDSGPDAIVDAGHSIEIADSGTVTEPPLRNWGESCSIVSSSVCAEGLSCINGICEEVCGRPGICTNCCTVSGEHFCEPLNSDVSLCKKKDGLLIELTWESESYNFDLYFTKAQYDHCNEKFSCHPGNCLRDSAFPMDFVGDGPAFGVGDPVMLLADTCGHGPETVHLGNSSFGNYKVAVHLNTQNDQCVGSQDQAIGAAKVTIYLDGAFHSEYSSTFAANGDLWELGYLDWINDNLVVTAYNGYESQWTCGGGEVP